ncbi:MAG TPA: LCP family protein [Candidatus Limnocylindrales bacterium]
MPTSLPRARRPAHAALVVAVLMAVVAAGCGADAPSPQPSGVATPSSLTPSAEAGTSPSEAPSASEPASGPPASAPPASAPPAPSAEPSGPASALGTKRLNILLVGTDNTREREPSELTDSVIVASLDPVGGSVSLYGLPRDLTDFPLPSGAIWHEKLNALLVSIRANPKRFGGTAADDPYDVLAGVIANLVDLPIEHYAVTDMDGLSGLVDALGGIDVHVDQAICDPGYHQLGIRGFEAAVGWWHLTGPQALALGRIRHNAGGSDFQRMRRQQEILAAIRDRILRKGAQSDPLAWLKKVPKIHTDLPADQIVAAGMLVAGLPADRFFSRLVQPFGRGGTEDYDARGYVLKANLDEIRDGARLLFTNPGRTPTTGRQAELPARPATVRKLPRFNGC